MTKQIERLDYSSTGVEGLSEEVTAAAWAEYKATHSPPGMWVGFAGILPDCTEAWTRIGLNTPFSKMELGASRKVVLTEQGNEWRAAALEDAWAHYDRALEVAKKVEEGAAVLAAVHGDTRLEGIKPWPHCLSWWEEACDEVDAHIDRMKGFTDKVPDVLVWCMEANNR
jgi:hypothetical protein